MPAIVFTWLGLAASPITVTSPTVNLGPGEFASGVSLAQFNPTNYPSTPVLQQVQLTLQVTFAGNLNLYGVSTGAYTVAYSLSSASVTARSTNSSVPYLSPVVVGFNGTQFVGTSATVALNPTVTGTQSVTVSNAMSLAGFTGGGLVGFDIDFAALYPQLVSTIPVQVAGLLCNERVTATVTATYTAAPVIALSGPTNFCYNGMRQGPSTVTVYGPTSTPTLSYQGSSGTVYGPSPSAPIHPGSYVAVASVASDANHSAATSQPLNFVIHPAPLTITAQDQSKTYGTPLVLGTGQTAFSAAGLVNGETVGSVTLSSNGGLAANATSGLYIVTPSSAVGGTFSPSDYNLTYVPGILTVVPAPSTIAVVDSGPYPYTGQPQGPTQATVTGSAGIVTFSYVGTGSTQYPTSQSRPSAIGSYRATAVVAPDLNHSGASSAPLAFSIGPAVPNNSDVPLLPPWGMATLILALLGIGSRSIRRAAFHKSTGALTILNLTLLLSVVWPVSSLAERAADVSTATKTGHGSVEKASPRRIELRVITAKPASRGCRIEWETGLEWGVVGFNLEHETQGGWKLVNQGLVVAMNEMSGGRYHVIDLEASNTRPGRYRLTALLASGESVELTLKELEIGEGVAGQIDPPQGSISRRQSLVNLSTLPMPSRHLGLQGPPTPVDLTTSTAGVKILTTALGMHFVSASALATVLGQPNSTVVAGWINSGMIALFSGGFDTNHQVTYIPANGYTSGGTTPGLYFYAQQVWNNYTTTNAYWLRAGTNLYASVSMGGPSPVPSGTYTAQFSAQSDAVSGLSSILTSTGSPQGQDTDQSFWFWKQLTASSPNDTWTTTFAVDHLTRGGTNMATLTLSLFGSTTTPQKVTVTLNGTVLDAYATGGSLSWSGIGAHQAQFTFPMSLLKDKGTSPSEGNNTLTAQALLPVGTAVSQFYVDLFSLSYRRTYSISSTFFPTLQAAADGTVNQTMTVSGFPGTTQPTILGFDVTDPIHIKSVTGITVAGSSGAWTATLKPSTSTSSYVLLEPTVNGAQAVPPASAFSLVYPPQLDDPTIRCSYLIVTHSSFTTSAYALAAYRSNQFRTKVVVMDDIYNQFGYGVTSPHALESFIKTAYANWAIPPRYLALVGNGTWDYRNLTAANDFFVPSFMIATPYGAFASDSRFGKVAADGLPRVIVGRFPVTSDSQFMAMLGKIRSYESEHVPSLKALLLADQPDSAGDFIARRDAVQAALGPKYVSTLIDPGYSPPLTAAIGGAIRTSVQTALNGGIDLFNYIGHGAQDQMGIQPYMQVSSQSPVTLIPNLTNTVRLPILVAMTCVVGDFAEPGFTCLGDALLRYGPTGAVAVVSPTGLSQDNDASRINTTLMQTLEFNSNDRLGDLVVQAYSQYNVNPPQNAATAFWLYNILGDPALKLVDPSH